MRAIRPSRSLIPLLVFPHSVHQCWHHFPIWIISWSLVASESQPWVIACESPCRLHRSCWAIFFIWWLLSSVNSFYLMRVAHPMHLNALFTLRTPYSFYRLLHTPRCCHRSLSWFLSLFPVRAHWLMRSTVLTNWFYCIGLWFRVFASVWSLLLTVHVRLFMF